MINAGNKMVTKRIMPLFLAMVFILLSIPQVAFAANFSAIVTSDSMNVYSSYTLSKKVASLDKGDVVVITKAKDGVAYFTYRANGNKGYAKISDMEKVSDVADRSKVMVSSAKFYQQASASGKYRTLKKGSSVNVLSTNGDWARIENGGYVCYTYINNLSIGTQAPEQTQTPTATTPTATAPTATQNPLKGFTKLDTKAVVVSKDMAVYESADLDATKLGTLDQGIEVKVTAFSKDWAYITLDNKSAFAPLKCMLPGLPVKTCSTAMVAKSNTKLYQTSMTSSTVVKSVSKGSEVLMLAYNKTWAYVQTKDGNYGFITCKTITTSSGEPTAMPTITPTPTPTDDGSIIKETITAKSLVKSTIYKSATTSSKKLGTLAANKNVTILARNNSWAYITMDGRYGFCQLSSLAQYTETEPTQNPLKGFTSLKTTAVSVVDTLSIYATPSESADKLTTTGLGSKVNVSAFNSDWAYVTFQGKTGYAPLRHLLPESKVTTLTPPAKGIVTSNTNLYKTSMTSSDVLAKLSRSDLVTVRAYGGNWAYVQTESGTYGFARLSVIKQYVDTEVTPTPTPSIDDAIPSTVTANSLVIYKSASTSSKKLGTIKKGAQVNVLQANNTWAYVEQTGKYGFCLLKGLTRNDLLEPTLPTDVKFDATVVYPNAPIYQSQSTSSASTTLSAGTTVNVYLFDDDWVYIGKDSARGYMQTKYLNKNDYTALSSGSSGSGVLALQNALTTLGYFDGDPAGNYSSLSESAVSRFQSAVGLSTTGKADVATQRILFGGYAPKSPILGLSLSSGSTGGNVQRLQTRLYYKGYLSKTSSVDGDYGSTTTSAVKLFQSTAGITVTGTANSATIQALYSNSAPKNKGTAPDAGTGGNDDGGGDGGSNTSKLPNNPTRAEKIEYMIYVAQQQLGKPYVYGATGPSKFDCSGLTVYCYKKIGVSMGRTAYVQGYNAGTKIEGLSNLKRGDIVCMNTVSDSDLSDHVGIYLGNNKMLHASSGSAKVIISSLGQGYYNRVFSWGRRVL